MGPLSLLHESDGLEDDELLLDENAACTTLDRDGRRLAGALVAAGELTHRQLLEVLHLEAIRNDECVLHDVSFSLVLVEVTTQCRHNNSEECNRNKRISQC